LRSGGSQAATEISMLRGYLEELKEKLREKERLAASGKEQGRREAIEQTSRLIREKRRLEALVKELSAGGRAPALE